LDDHITVTIFGQSFTFKTDSNSSLAQEVSEALVGEVKKAQKAYAGQPQVSQLAMLVSVALNFAQENAQLRQIQLQLENELKERSKRLLQMLEVSQH
jgi:hypothetical protein